MANTDFGFPTSHLTFPVCFSDWNADNAQSTLDAVYERANAAVQDRIDWYDRKAAAYGRRARRLRYAALVFVAIGGLAPLISAAFGDAFGMGERSAPGLPPEKWSSLK